MSTISKDLHPTPAQTTQGITNTSTPSTSSWTNRLRDFFAPSTVQKAAACTGIVVVLGSCGVPPLLATLGLLCTQRKRIGVLCAALAPTLLQPAEAVNVVFMEHLKKCLYQGESKTCDKKIYRIDLNNTQGSACSNDHLSFSTDGPSFDQPGALFWITQKIDDERTSLRVDRTLPGLLFHKMVKELGADYFCDWGLSPCSSKVVPWNISGLSCAPEILDTSVGKCLCKALDAAKGLLTTTLTTAQETSTAWVYQVTTEGMAEGGVGIGWMVLIFVIGFLLGAFTLYGAACTHNYLRRASQSAVVPPERKALSRHSSTTVETGNNAL